MVALQRAGIPVERYVAYEIDKSAISISKKNYPNIEQCGDVTTADFTQYQGFDLLIGGSPCQGFSFAGKQLNFDDPRSKLFFEFVRALEEAKPKYFLLENVKMKKEYEDIITEKLGVEPIEINSNLVSAQNRRRLYWTNIPNVSLPEDKGIMLKDIVHETEGIPAERLQEYIVPFDKTLMILDKEVKKGKIGYFRKDSQANRVYSVHDKAVTLCGESGGGAAKMGQYLFGCITPDRVEKRQNGQRFNDGNKFYTLTAQDRHGVLVDGYIRKLTPVECERLQTLPDSYTYGVSNAQRYKCLGNGWTVDVIAHIFKGLKGNVTMGKANREKGKRGERELASKLREYGYDCRRGVQYCGRTGAADVVGLPGVHIECKRVERLDLYRAVAQSTADARTGELPAVFHRRNNCDWLVTLPLDTFMTIYREYDAGNYLEGLKDGQPEKH